MTERTFIKRDARRTVRIRFASVAIGQLPKILSKEINFARVEF